MEQLYRSKKFLIPMLIFADYGVPMVVASYELTGRFDPEHELEHYPSAQATELHHEIHSAQMEKNETATEQLKEAQNQERAKIVGTSEEWKQYRSEFETIRNAAFDEEIAFSRDSLDHLFKRFDKQGDISLDKNGAIWMDFEDGDGKTKIGLSASNLLSPLSDPHLAYAVMLAATDHALKSPKHSRETMADFEKDWALLERARENCAVSAADPATAAAGPSRAILVARK
jgi:hypothetical protein